MEYTIDAKNRSLGRVASEAAVLLMGKNLPNFDRSKLSGVQVTITNASQLNITAKKQKQKTYTRYSGYPGGLKTETMNELLEKKGYEEVVRRAVYGMLPSNKLRSRIMQQLTINE